MSFTNETALKYAMEIYEALKPHCINHNKVKADGTTITIYDIKIAGSICRKMPYVEDIDIVCLPANINKFAEALYVKFGVGVKKGARKVTFKYMGMKVELWLPQHHDFFRILTIRQGSAEWVHKYISNAWVRKGWCGTKDGLRLKNECEETKVGSKGKQKSIYKCVTGNPHLPPLWTSQNEFFFWLGVNYVEPQFRL